MHEYMAALISVTRGLQGVTGGGGCVGGMSEASGTDDSLVSAEGDILGSGCDVWRNCM